MSEPENPHDDPEAMRLRSAQEDPWVMYMVVRRERVTSLAETLVAGAVSAVRCVDRYRDAAAWRAPFDAWLARSFRKVCLRANEKDWARLNAYDAGEGMAGDTPVLRALPPRTKSQRDKLLVNLQAFATADFAPPSDAPEPDFAMRLVLNGALTMSAGKAVAQVAHASLHACAVFGAERPEDFARWRALGMPCVIRRAEGAAWTALRAAERAVVVRDAGLTEIAPGSETFAAMAPCAREAWSDAFTALPRV